MLAGMLRMPKNLWMRALLDTGNGTIRAGADQGMRTIVFYLRAHSTMMHAREVCVKAAALARFHT
jgi:hypothetical protein